MMDTAVRNEEYERYTQLLLQRDELEKEAEAYQRDYTREFGELTVEVYELKIRCISLKKSIAYCLMARNRGEKPDEDAMELYLVQQMAAYYETLKNMRDELEDSRSGKPISAFRVEEIKKIYRRIAKMLHPDINPLTAENEELQEIFRRVQEAYRCNRLQKLMELEVLATLKLEELGAEVRPVEIENIEEKIEALEAEIAYIISNEPYLYGELFSDAVRMEEKQAALEKEKDEYTAYCAELEQQLALLMGDGNDG